MEEPLVSILTSVYNREEFIAETINSVLLQTYKNWEWIIIDDGSYDGTKDIIKSYNEPRIKYYYQKNHGIDGLCITYNNALAMANGKFITVLDSDDLWPNYKLEFQVKSLLENNAALSYGECCIINSAGKVIGYAKIPEQKSIAENSPIGAALHEFFMKANSFVFNPTILIRKTALDNIGGFVNFEGLSHDFTTWSTLSMKFTFKPLYKCLGYWRRHNKSIVFHNAKYRFLNKLKFIEYITDLNGGNFMLPGFKHSKEEIFAANKKRYNEYMKYFNYDRSMLLAGLGMYDEALNEFSMYLKENYTIKNYLIFKLFQLSCKFNYDFINTLRRFKEKLIK